MYRSSVLGAVMTHHSTSSSSADRKLAERVPVPPPLIYAAAFVLGAAAEFVAPTPDLLPLPLAVAVGLVGGLAWLMLDPLAMWAFRRANTSVVPNTPAAALVRAGPYRYTRNPMYLGMAVLLASAGLAFGLLWVLVFLPVVVALVDRLVIRREEAHLERAFGDEYRNYRRNVRRWL